MMEGHKRFIGQWIYRSLRNDTDIEKDFNGLEFGRGIITMESIDKGLIVQAKLDMGGNYILNLSGELMRQGNEITGIKMTGDGINGSSTQGWRYDYHGFIVPAWANGINQAFVVTGSVIRVVDHGSAKAGYVGTFYMVHQ